MSGSRTMRTDSGRNNNAGTDQSLLQCLILMVKEQNNQKDVLAKFITEMGQFRERMYEDLEKLQESVDSINKKLSSAKKCVCGGEMTTAGTKHKTKSRRRRTPDYSEEDTDPNLNNRGKEKRADKPGLDYLYDERHPTESPVPIKSDPPRNVQKPVAKSRPPTIGSDTRYSMSKVAMPNKSLLKAHPQESDFIALMKSLKVEVNAATIASVSSSAHTGDNNSLGTRPPALHTVVVLDTSESMSGKPFELARAFVNKVIDGIDTSAAECGLEEYLAVITCGESTGIVQPFTNDYLQIRNTIDQLRVGGRTPLMTSLTLALCYLELQSECVKVAEHVIMPRVIIVSDFDATIDTKFKGRDADNSEGRIKVQRELFNLSLTFKSRGFGVVCVPVGESNGPVAEGFVAKSNGELVKPEAVRDVGNYFRYQMAIGRAFADFDVGVRQNQEQDVYVLVQRTMPEAGLDKTHERGVVALLERILQKEDDIAEYDDDEKEPIAIAGPRSDNFVPQSEPEEPPDLPEWTPTRNVDNIGFEEMSGLPSIGSRVKRAEHWKWADQDSNGAGTVVGHKAKGLAYILWDNGQIGAYRHGFDGNQYDVRKTMDPRHVAPGDIDVGCCVIRGSDWERGDEDGGLGTVGVVVRKLMDRYVMVRWPSRVIETYRFGANNKWDLEVTLDNPHTARVGTPGPNGPHNVGADTHVSNGSQSNFVPSDLVDLKPWWSWMDKHDQWRPFSEGSVIKLEQKKNSGLSLCLVDYENKPVKIYMDQEACDIGGERYPVKREMLKGEEIESMKMLEKFLQPID